MINFITQTSEVMAKSSKAVVSTTRLDAITYVIALDSKARLVLPLEIRDSLGLDKSNCRVILKLFKDNDSLLLKFEKPSLDIQTTLCSKNVGLVNNI